MSAVFATVALALLAAPPVAMWLLVRSPEFAPDDDRCDQRGCPRPGLWQPRDGGPGAVCTLHYQVPADG